MNNAEALSLVSIYGAMACYAVALPAFAVDLSGRWTEPGRRRWAGIGMSTTWLGFVFHLGGVLGRGLAAGRVPWANMYEFTITFTLVAVGTFLGVCVVRDVRYLGALVVGPVLLLLGAAVSVLYVAADGLQPALQSYWLVIHVSLATIAAGVLSLGCAFAVLQLVRDRFGAATPVPGAAGVTESVTAGAAAGSLTAGAAPSRDLAAGTAEPTGTERDTAAPDPGRGGALTRLMARLPAAADLERLSFRCNAVGFVLWTFTLVAGAIWAEHAWGRYWEWDPKEVFTLVVWVVYAAYLHARTTRGWDGRRAAWFVVVAYACVLFNFFGVNLLFDSRHAYSGL